MRQFDICPLRKGRDDLVVVLQHELSVDLDTCVVAPLVPVSRLPCIKGLRPVVSYQERDYVIAIGRLAAVKRRNLASSVESAVTQRDEIIAAIDLLFTGF